MNAAIEGMTNTVSEEDKEKENGGKKESNSEADDDAMHLDKPAMQSTLCTRLAYMLLVECHARAFEIFCWSCI